MKRHVIQGNVEHSPLLAADGPTEQLGDLAEFLQEGNRKWRAGVAHSSGCGMMTCCLRRQKYDALLSGITRIVNSIGSIRFPVNGSWTHWPTAHWSAKHR